MSGSAYIAALVLGFAGSFHCVGMCGPIALALPVHRKNNFIKTLSILSYNIGRAISYSVLGALIGIIGRSFALAGFQQILSVASGIILLLFFLYEKRITQMISGTVSPAGYVSKLKTAIFKSFRSNSGAKLFSIGLLNGLLPCGFVYMGLTGALATGSSAGGAFFMFIFGVGTLPAMFTVAYAGQMISAEIRNKIRKVVPVFVIGMAFLLIMRGLNLGIPYISPMAKVSSEKGIVKQQCCHK